MQKVVIISVGRLKEDFFKKAEQGIRFSELRRVRRRFGIARREVFFEFLKIPEQIGQRERGVEIVVHARVERLVDLLRRRLVFVRCREVRLVRRR